MIQVNEKRRAPAEGRVGGTYGDSAEAASSGGGANNEVEDEFDEVEAGRGEEEAGGEDEEEQGAGNTPAAGLPKGTKSGKMRRAREANTAARRARVHYNTMSLIVGLIMIWIYDSRTHSTL